MEVNNNRERIKGKDFVKGGVYKVYNKDNLSLGIYFYPTSYPERMIYEHNTRGTLSKLSNKLFEPLKLLILYSRIYHSGTGKYMKFDKSKIYGKQPISLIRSKSSYESMDLSGLDLSYAKLRDSHLVMINLSNTNLSHADLTGVDLTGTDLTSTNLTGAKLGKTILKDIESSGIIGSPDTLPKGYYLVNGCIIGPDTEIPESLSDKYRKIKIGNGNNTKQYLVGPSIDLIGVDLSKIKRFDLNNADLTGANLSRAILTGVRLSDVNLTDVNLTDVNLTEAFFYDSVILTGIKTGGIKGIPKKLPKGYYLVDGYIIGPDIDIPNTITLKKYRKIKIKNNKNMTKEYIIGPNVILTGVDLTGTDLTGADLTNAILTNAILTGVDLTNVTLTGAVLIGIISGEIKGNPILPNGYKLINGYIIGPNIDLTGVDLTETDLTGVDLTGIDLTGVDLTGTDLTGVDLTGTDLTGVDLTNSILTGIKSDRIKGEPKLPKRYILIGGFIIGPNVNLSKKRLVR
jgi:uncharacterized protein YjbI with pentapeptide repeats